MIELTTNRIRTFRRKIFDYYAKHGRDLPFRRLKDPYKITLIEIMLQQTQVERVLPKYKAWIKKWPNWKSLARASTRELLVMWSGLGYNRRALNLGKLARTVVSEYGGVLPEDRQELESLPGIGPYTACAILIFAFDRQIITIDTNIRRVMLHEFGLPPSTGKQELEELARRVLPRGRSRDWHNALMDYNRLALPQRLPTIPPISRQSRFTGSIRQIRGEIIRQLTTKSRVTIPVIARTLGCLIDDVRTAADALGKEGLVNITNHTIRLAPDRE